MLSNRANVLNADPKHFVRQMWIAKILIKNCENTNTEYDVEMSKGVLVDGRVLCRVANIIASGSVETIYQDRSHNVREREHPSVWYFPVML